MKRSLRSTLARETVEICDTGRYVAADGVTVDLAADIRSAVAQTRLFDLAKMSDSDAAGRSVPARFSVTNETTVAALRRLEGESGGHLACLNFASARNAGGGFLNGSEAQEESLARSSALYPCLLAAPEYYERNRAAPGALYLDLAIWSPAVPFFRDDEGTLLDKPCRASVITAPAPNAGAVAANTPAQMSEALPTLRRRAEFVLTIAAEQAVRRLVLGAWGCGVFRNDPREVAGTFATLLLHGKFATVFDDVIFAVYDRTSDQQVLRAFEDVFAKSP